MEIISVRKQKTRPGRTAGLRKTRACSIHPFPRRSLRMGPGRSPDSWHSLLLRLPGSACAAAPV